MAFGSKVTDIRSDIQRSSGGDNFLWHVKAGEDFVCQFVQDPEDWFRYFEHYSEEVKFFPCTGDGACPGCTSTDEKVQRKSKRYVASVVEKKSEKVVPLKITVDLANRLVNKADRNGGTLRNREYTLIRIGKGFETTYDVETGERLPEAKVDALEVEPILQSMFEMAWGNTTLGASPNREKKAAPKATEDEVITEEQLKAMTISEMHHLMFKHDIDVPDNVSPFDENQVRDFLLAKFAV